MFQARFPNPLPKCVQLIFAAFCHQLDPPIRQIAHGSSHFEFVRNLPDAIAEADALDSARIEHLHPFALHTTIPRDNVPQSDWTREEILLSATFDYNDKAIPCQCAQIKI